MSTKTLTAPLAIIKVKGVTIGKMKDIRITETFRRGRVSGIGELTAQELPVQEFNGTLTAGFYEVDFTKTGIPGALNRNVSSVEQFVDNILLDDSGVDITIYKKVVASETNGIKKSGIEPHLTIRNAFIDRDSMDLSEGQIAGHNQDFTYTDPVLKPL